MVHLFFPDLQQPAFDIIKALRTVRCSAIKIWLPAKEKASHKALSSANLMPIGNNISNPHTEICFEWDYLKQGNGQVEILPDEYYYWLYRKDQALENDSFAIVTKEKPSKLGTKTIFKDGVDKDKLPSDWYRFKCLDSMDSVFRYCVEKGAIDCILLNPERFDIVEGRKYNGAQIYKEKRTGYYWYKDTFHKNGSEHLEVFDSLGEKHLGEASVIDGELDTSKADTTKKPIL